MMPGMNGQIGLSDAPAAPSQGASLAGNGMNDYQAMRTEEAYMQPNVQALMQGAMGQVDQIVAQAQRLGMQFPAVAEEIAGFEQLGDMIKQKIMESLAGDAQAETASAPSPY